MIFRHKPVEVEAVEWDGSNWGDVEYFLAARNNPTVLLDGTCLLISTAHGVVKAFPGDWVVRGVYGDLYPCGKDVFLRSYEPV